MRPSSTMGPGHRKLALRPRAVAGIAAAVVAAGLVAPGCKTDGAVVPTVAPPPPRREAGLRAFGPAQYLQQSNRWIERTAAGTDLVVSNGRRLEIKGNKLARTSPSDPDLEGGARVPSWVKGPARYVFWKDRELYVAATFFGDLVKVATTLSDVSDTFDWLDGVGVETDSGTYLLVPGTAADMKDARLASLPVPGAAVGMAADAKRAVVTNVFGRALLTVDGGKVFRDLSEDVGDVRYYEVRGDDLVLQTGAGRDRFVGPNGALSESAVAPGPLRGSPPPDLDEAFDDFTKDDALYGVAGDTIPLGNGVLLMVQGATLAKVEADTGRVINATKLEDLFDHECSPVRLADAVLLACRGQERATVIDVTGVPRIERTFEVDPADSTALDAFAIADGVGIGYLGPCVGPPPVRDEVDAVSGASQRNGSTQRSPVFCARASADHWIEHRLDPEDAADVLGWTPRPGGDAVAIVARLGRHVPDDERVATSGGLRVVRIPRAEPPLSLSMYSSHGAGTVSRDMRAGADGSIEAWINNNNYGNSTVAVVIDAEGHTRVRPIPARVNNIASSGPFALASSDDGRIFETVDWGKRWIEVPPPPGISQNARPSSCSAAGCNIGNYVRVGWDSVDAKIPAAVTDYESARAEARELREKYDYRRPPPKPTAVKLSCSYASSGEGARQPDSYGFGFSPPNAPRMYGGSNRLGWIGAFSLPWWQGPMPTGMDIDLAWVEPLDLEGRIHRATIPLSRVGVSFQQRPYDARFGYVMDEEGRLELLPTGHKDTCLGPVLEEAGIVLKVGGCLEEPSVGVRIKDRIFTGSARWGSLVITAIDLPSASGGAAAIGSATRELRTVRTPSSFRGYTAGIGARAGQPVGVAVDGRGEAVLAPIDPNDGYLGEAERLAPLSELRVGTDGKCPTQEKLGEGEARVVLPFETAIGLVKTALPGVSATGSAGVAIVRWSKDLACLEAVEMNVRDERYDPDSNYEPAGTLRKVIARFAKAPPKRGGAEKGKAAPKKKAAPAASTSASASASASAAATLPPWVSPYPPPPPAAPSASASASAVPTVAPIPVSPPLPKGAGEGTLLLIQQGSELRQKLFCTGTTP